MNKKELLLELINAYRTELLFHDRSSSVEYVEQLDPKERYIEAEGIVKYEYLLGIKVNDKYVFYLIFSSDKIENTDTIEEEMVTKLLSDIFCYGMRSSKKDLESFKNY